jgi:putative membrane protein
VTEPDARFSLANERTFLAWLRTALAMTAGGVGLAAASTRFQPTLARVAAVVIILCGAAMAFTAARRWAAIDRAIRAGEPLPSLRPFLHVSYLLGAIVTILAIAVALS